MTLPLVGPLLDNTNSYSYSYIHVYIYIYIYSACIIFHVFYLKTCFIYYVDYCSFMFMMPFYTPVSRRAVLCDWVWRAVGGRPGVHTGFRTITLVLYIGSIANLAT